MILILLGWCLVHIGFIKIADSRKEDRRLLIESWSAVLRFTILLQILCSLTVLLLFSKLIEIFNRVLIPSQYFLSYLISGRWDRSWIFLVDSLCIAFALQETSNFLNDGWLNVFHLRVARIITMRRPFSCLQDSSDWDGLIRAYSKLWVKDGDILSLALMLALVLSISTCLFH